VERHRPVLTRLSGRRVKDLIPDERQKLECLVSLLNGDPETERRYWQLKFGSASRFAFPGAQGGFALHHLAVVLKKYVDSWLAVRPDARLWQSNNPKLSQAVERALRSMRPALDLTTNQGAVLYWPTHVGIGAENDAERLFVELFTSRLLGRQVGKCKREGCGRYYFSPSACRKTEYCPGGQCAHNQTSKESNQRRRKKERDEKMQRITQTIAEWERLRRRPRDWKPWVAQHAKVSPKFITHAVNKRELMPPKA